MFDISLENELKEGLKIKNNISEGIFDSPNYTRPEIFENIQVPKIVMSFKFQGNFVKNLT